MNKIFVYLKNAEEISELKQIIDIVKDNKSEINIISENKRAFRELEKIKMKITVNDVLIISDVSSFGINNADALNQLEWFINKSICVAIYNVESTYSFGVTQPMNKAVLTTVSQSIMQNHNITQMPVNHRRNSGRSKIEYPENWEELYDLWIDKKLSSKEFLDKTGLKKATFYNLITEYRTSLKELEKIRKQYKLS
jgi:hypothetical protein